MAKKETTKKVEAKAEAVASKQKTFTGVVVSDKMKDTIVVKIGNYKKHPKYHKFLSSDKKFKAHDAGNTCKIGDTVTIAECAPMSKDKHFVVVK
ncbi:MAG: 30S ribosomal protein S17 [bacterium]|jgi:small subunit ribosomal protein S17